MISTLNNNIQALADVGDFTNITEQLAVDLTGNLLKSRQWPMGHVFRQLHFLGRLFFGVAPRAFEENTVYTAIRYTSAIFSARIQEMHALCEEMASLYLVNATSARLRQVRYQIITIAEALPSLITMNHPLALQNTLNRIERVFRRTVPASVLTEQERARLVRFEENYALMLVEGCMQQSLPAQELRLLMMAAEERGRELNAEEEAAIDRWIRRVAENPTLVTPFLLNKALVALIRLHFPAESDEKRLVRLYDLELQLTRKGCTLFETTDPIFAKWIETKTPKETIGFTNGQPLKLGDRLQNRFLDSQGLMLFRIVMESGEDVEASRGMMLFGRSISHLNTWKLACRQESWLVPPISIAYHDPEGKYIIVERLTDCLADVQWKTQGGSVVEADKPRLSQISALIRRMVVENTTPRNLSPGYLFYNSDSILRSIVPISRADGFDYNAIVDFVFTVSQGKLILFREILRRSRLAEHPIGQFYLRIAREHLREQAQYSIEDDAARSRIQEVSVVERAKNMVTAVTELKARVFDTLIRSVLSPHENTQALRDAITEQLIAFHADTNAPVTHWPDAADRIGALVSLRYPHLFRSSLPQGGNVDRSPMTVFDEASR